ncbi:DUF3153 domain-containing protein [Salinifilum ghardaiensis]
MDTTNRRRRPRGARTALLVALLVAATVALTGCLHLSASINITDDDRVSGELRVSTRTAAGQEPFRVEPPPHLADRVTVEPYTTEGRQGSHLSFHDLTFHEVETLAKELSPSESRYEVTLRRNGTLVDANARVDLTPLANTNSSVLVRISAPGQITNSNGQESAGTVTWNLEPGEVTHMAVTYQYSSSAVGPWTFWAAAVGLGTLGVAVLVGLLALRTHLHTRVSPEGAAGAVPESRS